VSEDYYNKTNLTGGVIMTKTRSTMFLIDETDFVLPPPRKTTRWYEFLQSFLRLNSARIDQYHEGRRVKNSHGETVRSLYRVQLILAGIFYRKSKAVRCETEASLARLPVHRANCSASKHNQHESNTLGESSRSGNGYDTEQASPGA